MTHSNRLSFLLLLATVALIILWSFVSNVVVPPIIESAYRGESLPILNRMISGQAVHPVEHYLAGWSIIFRTVLVVLLVAAVILLVARYLEVQRVDHFIQKYKLFFLCGIIAYLIAAHYWFLGFTTWDAFSYRIPPIVELIQSGNLGGEKFDLYAARYFYPFFELLHFPFLKLFGLPGLFFSFSLVLFPLAIAAVYWFVLELTQDRRWATYSTMVYIGIPFVNEQPFAGYIDFAVLGALAFFLLTLLLVLRRNQPFIGLWALFVAATFVFSMSRQHTPYLALFIFGSITVWHLGPWHSRSIRSELSRLPLLCFVFALGMAPAVYLHLYRFLEFGSPIYPYQLKFMGVGTSAGQPNPAQPPDWLDALSHFVGAWLWPGASLPLFFDSRSFGGGLFLWIAIIALPIIRKSMNRHLVFVLALLMVITFILRDLWLPRYAFSFVLAIVLCGGGALALLAARGPRWAYAAILVVSVLHLFGRPIYVGAGMALFDQLYWRANLSESSLFITRSPDFDSAPAEIYPDWGADLLIVYPVRHKFVLPLYGKHLSNRIIGRLDPTTLDKSCRELRDRIKGSQRNVLVVDQSGRLDGQCAWVCEMPRPWGCMAQRLAPNDPENAKSALITTPAQQPELRDATFTKTR